MKIEAELVLLESSNMKKFLNTLGTLIFIISYLDGIYVGGYLMFIKPITTCITAFDLGTLTGAMIGWSIVKCVFAGSVCGIIVYFGYLACILLRHLADTWR